MAPPRIRRALPRQDKQGAGGTRETRRSISGCCPVKVSLSAGFLAAKVSVVVWFSRRSIRPSGQLDPMAVNKSNVR
nr:hypothetical protein [Dromedary astrovirus]